MEREEKATAHKRLHCKLQAIYFVSVSIIESILNAISLILISLVVFQASSVATGA
jgi:hypothetical protein